MARNEVTFLVNLRKEENVSSRSYGKYFPEAESREPLSLKGFARHLSEHGKLATYDMLVLVLQNVVSCMKELTSQGQPVKLDGLGTFYPSVESVKGGVESVAKAQELGAAAIIAGVHLNFRPEGAKGEKLTSRAFKELCVFELHDVVKAEKKTVEGKERTYQTRTPIATFAVATADPDPEP